MSMICIKNCLIIAYGTAFAKKKIDAVRGVKNFVQNIEACYIIGAERMIV